jgi:hypothetical protein
LVRSQRPRTKWGPIVEPNELVIEPKVVLRGRAPGVTAALFGAARLTPRKLGAAPFGRSAASMPPWAGAAGAELENIRKSRFATRM